VVDSELGQLKDSFPTHLLCKGWKSTPLKSAMSHLLALNVMSRLAGLVANVIVKVSFFDPQL
jgi:hypothetical protein